MENVADKVRQKVLSGEASFVLWVGDLAELRLDGNERSTRSDVIGSTNGKRFRVISVGCGDRVCGMHWNNKRADLIASAKPVPERWTYKCLILAGAIGCKFMLEIQ